MRRTDETALKLLTDNVTIDGNVFGSFVKHRVSGNVQGSLVVTVEGDWQLNRYL